MTRIQSRGAAACYRAALTAGILTVSAPALAQDAARGAGLYLKLPLGAASCVSCHGPDPTQNRNRLLFAADRPDALVRALNTVAAMGGLRSDLSDVDVADIAAYLGRVLVVSSDQASVALWPATVEFGTLTPGQVSPEHRITLANRGGAALTIGEPRLQGIDARLRHNCPPSLQAGSRCEGWVQFIAGSAGGSGGAFAVSVGSLGAPLLVGLSSEVRNSPVGMLSTESTGDVDFGQITAGSRSDLSVRLRSHGDLPVTLGVTTLTGPDRARFAVEGDCAAGLVLPPGTFCTLGLSYRPAVAGTARAALQWRSDGLNPGNLILTGSATAADAPAPAPAPTPTPTPAPSPTPATPSPQPSPSPAPDGNGGGGCAMSAPSDSGGLPVSKPVDPLLLLLAALAAWRLGRRRTT